MIHQDASGRFRLMFGTVRACFLCIDPVRLGVELIRDFFERYPVGVDASAFGNGAALKGALAEPI